MKGARREPPLLRARVLELLPAALAGNPALEVAPERAASAQEESMKQVVRVLHAGAAEIAWSTRYEVDYGLRWDHKRQVWAAADGFAYGMPEKVGEGAS
jgi:hypothetical protein